MKQNGMSPLSKRMLALFAVAVIAVLGSAITIRHVSNQLTRGLTQLVPGRSVTEAREDLTDVPDPRDSVFVTETTAPPTTAMIAQNHHCSLKRFSFSRWIRIRLDSWPYSSTT